MLFNKPLIYQELAGIFLFHGSLTGEDDRRVVGEVKDTGNLQ